MKRVVFFGTPNLALPFLDALHKASNFDLVAVVTQPDKPVGRKQVLTPTPVKVRAQELDLNVLELKNLKSKKANSKLTDLKADLFVVVAYGKIIPGSVLDLAPSINVHPSLLPKYRGPSPMQSAILNGDSLTGISIMLLDEGMDSGPVLAQEEIKLSDHETAVTLENKVCQIGPELLLNTIEGYLADQIKPAVQDNSEAIVCTMLERSDAEITLNETCEEIDRKIRAFDPWPGTYFELDSKRIKIIRARLDQSGLNILEVQPAGKKPMEISSFINGYLS
jgi:methionyl-tRNA formyltransferase